MELTEIYEAHFPDSRNGVLERSKKCVQHTHTMAQLGVNAVLALTHCSLSGSPRLPTDMPARITTPLPAQPLSPAEPSRC